jgi:glutamate N-acetyltransferase/amino-acid N-acetyltransferase
MSVTFANGFKAAGVRAGLKVHHPERLDVAVVKNDGPQDTVAGVFTTNRVNAAPVKYCRGALKATGGHARAVIVNSGGANACTGMPGLQQSIETARVVSEFVGEPDVNKVLVASTGLIGKLLALPNLLIGAGVAVRELRDNAAAGDNAANAILSTDNVSKQAQSEGAGGYKVGGMAKGAGMLAPQLATMISVITTDAVLTPAQADEALRFATSYSFDRVDSDGCMSTNDTVLLLANGASGVTPDLAEFKATLTVVASDLAAQMIADAEGASHAIKIRVENAYSEQEGLAVAKSVSRSNLMKCAIFGNDPNWGRILSSVGVVPESEARFNADLIDVYVNGVKVSENGGLGEDRSKVDLASSFEVEIVIDLKAGDSEVEVLTNDLTYGYVKENAEYSS